MPEIKVKGQTVQTEERPQTNGHTRTRTLPNVLSPLLRGRYINVTLTAYIQINCKLVLSLTHAKKIHQFLSSY